MPKLDKTYNITLDIKQTINNSIPQYYISDNDTSEIMITITDDKKPIQLDNVIVLMVAIAPDREKLYDFIDVRTSEEGLIYCNLKSQFKDLEGTWYARLMIISNEEKLVTDTFSYNVKTDDFIDMNDEVIDDDRYPLLSDIISRLSTIEITELSRQNIESIRVREEKIRVANENIRILNEQTRQTQHTTSLQSIDSKIVDIENRFRTMTASQQQDSEVIDARDGETSLHARLERDLAKGKTIEEKAEGTYITVDDSVDGYLTDVELLGNTTQDPLNLADIQSVGTLEEDGRYKMSILSCGKNLLNLLKSNEVHRLNYQSDLTLTDTGFKVSSTKTGDVVGFITKCKPNTTYTVSFNDESNIKGAKYFRSFTNFPTDTHSGYNETKNGTNVSSFTLTTTSDCRYLFFGIYVVVSEERVLSNIQIEEGIVATTYEPYQCNKSSILLPCQLEKVGDVADRLFRREDGVWCVEKNVESRILDGSEGGWSKRNDGDGVTTMSFHSQFSGIRPKSLVVSDKFPLDGVSSTNGIEGVSIDNTTFLIEIQRDKLPSADLSGFKTWLMQNHLLIKYASVSPQIIELPLDVQIQLNTFTETTHIYTSDTIVEPTIKATVPKSLGASVNSLVNKTDNLSQRLENVETLKEGSELEVTTDKGYVVCQDTRNGYVDDLCIEGNTLVNLGIKDKSLPKDTSWFSACKDRTLLKNNTTYTIITITNKPIEVPLNLITNASTPSQTLLLCLSKGESYSIKKITLSNDTPYLHYGNTDSNTLDIIINSIVLEGDHTQNPPSYFEGLKSVGEGVDKIEVLSSGNKGYINFITLKDNTPNYRINPLTLLPESKANNTLTNYQRVIGGTNYKFTSDTLATVYIGVCWYDLNKNPISASTDVNGKTVQAPSNSKYCRYWFDSSLYNDNPCVCGFLFNSNKKQILFKNKEGNYEKPILRSTGSVSDTIEKHSDGKYYFHKRCEEVVLNGGSGENWIQGSYSASTLCLRFDVTSLTNVKLGIANCISDKMPTYKDANNDASEKENYYIATHQANSRFVIVIPKSKLSTQDLTGFKTWLQSNPVTVVYQLATEEVYECVNLDLDSYEGETSIIFDGGAISPKITFKIASHIANTVQVLKDRINYLEDKVINMFKAVLAGDVQTLAYELYPEDFKKDTQESEQLETVEGTELL